MSSVRVFKREELAREITCLHETPGPAPWGVSNWPAPNGWQWGEHGAYPDVEFQATDPSGEAFFCFRYYDVVHYFDGQTVVVTGTDEEIRIVKRDGARILSQSRHLSVPRPDCPPVELIFVAKHSIYICKPHEGTFVAAQQSWFLDSDPDLGYEWIAIAVRPADCNYILASGFRVPTVVLSQDAKELIGIVDLGYPARDAWFEHWRARLNGS